MHAYCHLIHSSAEKTVIKYCDSDRQKKGSTYFGLFGFEPMLTDMNENMAAAPTTLPASWYTSKAFYNLERRAVFLKVRLIRNELMQVET